MRKYGVLFGALLVFLSGCKKDDTGELIGETISLLTTTTSEIKAIANSIDSAVTAARDKKMPLDTTVLAEAKKKAIEIRGRDDLKFGEKQTGAKQLQYLKTRLENRKESITESQREEYETTYGEQYRQGMVAVDKAQKALDESLRNAEQAHKDLSPTDDAVSTALQELREAIQGSQYEFALLTKKQM